MKPIRDLIKEALAQADELATARAEAQATVGRLRRLVERQIAGAYDSQLSLELDRLLAAEELIGIERTP